MVIYIHIYNAIHLLFIVNFSTPKLNLHYSLISDDLINALTLPQLLDYEEYNFLFHSYCQACDTPHEYSIHHGCTMFCRWCVTIIKGVLYAIYEKYCLI